MLAHNASYRLIAQKFPDISQYSIGRYVRNGCPGGGLPTKEAVKQEAAKNNKVRAISGMAVVQGVLDDVTARLSKQPKDSLDRPVTMGLKIQLEAAKMLGVGSQSKDRGAISDYIDQLRAEEDQYQEKK